MDYKGVTISFQEGTGYTVTDVDQEYTVSRQAQNGLIFSASSKFGVSYSTNSEAALNDAKALIDRNVA